MGQDPEAYYPAGNELELQDAILATLDEITSTSCTVDLTPFGLPQLVQIPYTSIEADGMYLPYLGVEGCDPDMDGWAWLDFGVVLTLCNGGCDMLRNGAAVDVWYGCPPPW